MELDNNTELQNGKYRIIRVLGHGGFGITYLAEQVLMGRKVCIKEFFMKDYCNRDCDTSRVTLGTISGKELVDRFRVKFIKEAQTIARLQHPNIITIFDVFEENDTAYYVMEYLDGESLSDVAKRMGAMPEAMALNYIRPAASALKEAHAQRIMHLDVKPANIMVTKNGRVVLIDFGMAKQYDEAGEQTSSTPVGLSHGYAPMEQYKAGGVKEFSPQSDIYALGATLYRLLSGKVPPQPTDILEDGLPPLPQGVSKATSDAIIKAMEVRKKDRQQNIDEFLSMLSSGMVSDYSEETVILNSTDEETVLVSDSSADSMQSDTTMFAPEDHTELVSTQTTVATKSSNCKTPEQLYQDACSASEGQKESLLKVLKEAADAGSSEAMYKYFEALYNKKWASKYELKASFKYLKKSADQGCIDALTSLGRAYITNPTEFCKCNDYTGIYQKNRGLGIQLLKKASEAGNADAQYCLGDFYSSLTQPNSKEAFVFYKQAAEQGHVLGMFNVADCYLNGKGVNVDKKKGVIWLEKCSNSGNADAQYGLGIIYEEGEIVPQDLKKASSLFEQAAEQWHVLGMLNLADCYLNGQGVGVDKGKGALWLERCAIAGNADAQYGLGIIFEEGKIVSQDLKKASNLFEQAAEQGHVSAMLSLANCYMNGIGVTVDNRKCVKWLERGAKAGNADAQNKLGDIYSSRFGLTHPRATEYYKQAAEQGHLKGMFNYGCSMIAINHTKGLSWIQKSADQGLQEAIDFMKEYNGNIIHKIGKSFKTLFS